MGQFVDLALSCSNIMVPCHTSVYLPSNSLRHEKTSENSDDTCTRSDVGVRLIMGSFRRVRESSLFLLCMEYTYLKTCH